MWISQFFFTIGIGVSAYYFICVLKSFLLHVKVFVLSKCGCRKTDFTRKYGSWAVVTGASAGIGLAFARELASKRMNVVLMSCEEEDLKRAAAEIESEFSVQTKVIHVDFASGEDIYEFIWTELKDLQIGILVNNVGIYCENPTPVSEMEIDFMRKMVMVNCTPVIMMTRLVLPGMIKNRRGAIVNISSFIDLQPTPLQALYSATKAFVTVFTKAIQFENRGTGVTIQILSPGAVNTYKTENGDLRHADKIYLSNPVDFVRNAIGTLGVLDYTTGSHFYGFLTTFLEMMPTSLRTILSGYIFSRLAKSEMMKAHIKRTTHQLDKIK